MNAWLILLAGVAIGVLLAVTLLSEARLYRRSRARGGVIDLTGVSVDPDDWFAGR